MKLDCPFFNFSSFSPLYKQLTIWSGVNRSSSDAHEGEASDVCVVRRVFRAASESLHCSTSTSSSISAYRSTDNGPTQCDDNKFLLPHNFNRYYFHFMLFNNSNFFAATMLPVWLSALRRYLLRDFCYERPHFIWIKSKKLLCSSEHLFNAWTLNGNDAITPMLQINRYK